ncbi:RICIN domain-containing protein [Streptomyces europaeiscabiei]|uniref:RICIN domain-containing protein n=1 Tax=Streptomyces europaeiscabiei TaxID=146819 RepID=UPI0029B98165|nr:RICIN domain-containing protein [Streptomyces europaeiscabiei]MDX3613189.1 RICIN domain-containing protein [Streptomyces europaeiscabiei]WUD34279.1 RICIN domain-containing protein [Streptomyces europaeiscabiei]
MSEETPSGRGSGHGVSHRRRPWHTAALSLLTLLAALVAFLIPASAAQAATTVTFTTGAARTDTSGNTLQLHGMGIIKVGDTWYGFGENKTGVDSTNTSFQAIACYSSTDLANWTFRGNALSLQSSGDLGPSRVVERPKVIFNATTQKFVMYVHIDSLNYAEAKVGVATSSTPCGSYDYLGSSRPLGQLSRDIGLFQDTDGTAYLMTEDRNNGLRINLLSSDYLTQVRTVAILGSGGGANSFESPAMIKANGIYYLLASRLTGWSLNDNVYSTATSIGGTWAPMRTFAAPGTKTYGSQTSNIITVAGTSGTTYIYAGDRWNPSDLGESELIWLPLTIRGTTVNLGQYPTWSLDVEAGTWTPNSGVPSAAVHTLTNSGSSKLLDVTGSSTATNANVIQWNGTGGANQQWNVTKVADNIYTLKSVNSGLCLDVPNKSTAQNIQLIQWTCNGGANQQFFFDLVGSFTGSQYMLVAVHSGLNLGVLNNATTAGAAVVQLTGTGAATQKWTVG